MASPPFQSRLPRFPATRQRSRWAHRGAAQGLPAVHHRQLHAPPRGAGQPLPAPHRRQKGMRAEECLYENNGTKPHSIKINDFNYRKIKEQMKIILAQYFEIFQISSSGKICNKNIMKLQ